MSQTKLFFILTVFMILGIAACSSTASGETEEVAAAGSQMPADEHMAENMHDETKPAADQHMHDNNMPMDHMHAEPPEEFAGLVNPYAEDADAIESGEALYQTYCATCHGVAGQGDGPAAEALDPKPATLADGMMMGELSDGYLFWRVTKGGQIDPFNSAMPAWEGTLTEDQRWQVIRFVRTLSNEAGGHHMEDNQMGHEEDD